MDEQAVETLTQKTVLWRGVKNRCPRCGKGKLLRRFITQNSECSECHEDFSELRADDAPPWLTILITGHIVVPLIVEFAKYDVFSEVVELSIIWLITAMCVYFILPRAKGIFLAGLWWLSKR